MEAYLLLWACLGLSTWTFVVIEKAEKKEMLKTKNNYYYSTTPILLLYWANVFSLLQLLGWACVHASGMWLVQYFVYTSP